MVYEDNEVTQIRENLTDLLIKVPEFLDGTIDDVKTTLREYLINVPHTTPYVLKKKDNTDKKKTLKDEIARIKKDQIIPIEEQMKAIEDKKNVIYDAIHGPKKTTDPSLLSSYVAEFGAYVQDLQNYRIERDRYSGKINENEKEIKSIDGETITLGKDLKAIVDSFSDEKVKTVIEASDIYADINRITPIQLGTAPILDDWIKNCTEELSENELQEKLKIGDYTNMLANEYLIQKREKITKYVDGILQNQQGNAITRSTFFGLNDKTRKQIYDVLTAVKSSAGARAKAEIEGKLSSIKTKRNASDTTYNESLKTIDDVLQALPVAVGNEEAVAEELVEYSGGNLDEVKALGVYAEKLNGLVASNVANIDYGGTNFRQTYQNILDAVSAGMPKEEANKLLAILKDTIKSTKEKTTRGLDGKITKINTVDTAYKDARKTIDDVLQALPVVVGNEESVAEELFEYSGGGTLEDIKTSDIYATRLNELVSNNVAGMQYGGISFQDTYNNIIAAVNANMPKKDANKLLARLNDTIKFTKDKVTRELNDKIKEVGETYTEYKDASKSLESVFDADLVNLLDDFLHIASEYGYAKLSGDAELNKIKDNDSYKKIENALVRKEAAEDKLQNKMDYEGAHNLLISDVYRAVLRDVNLSPQQGGITKSKAVKYINEINGRVGAIKRRVAKGLDRDITNIYRNVIAGSTLDNTPLRDGNKYMIMDRGGSKLLENFDSNDGTHAEAGLGWYFEQFGEEITENIIEQPGWGKRLWGRISGTPATSTTRTIRKRRNNVKDLTYNVVEKHKNASRNAITEKNSISIDEAVMVALGLAAEKKKSGNIATKWSNLRGLTYASDINAILTTYLDAADLGAEINNTAKMYTGLKGNQFTWLDNHINEKAGFVYKYKDRAIDLVNKIFERAKTDGSMKVQKEELEETNWTKEVTAIKPNKYPLETMLTVAAGLGIGAYALLRNTGKKDTDKIKSGGDSGILNFWEVAKEVLLIRLLSGKHK